MEAKTKIKAEPGKQDLLITRDFDIPVDLLFKAYTEAEFIEQWMGTRVIKLENHTHGCWQFETTDPRGNKFGFNGTIHEVVLDKKIVRTFEMSNIGFDVQLEFLEFEKIDEDRSRLNMQIIYRSPEMREQQLKLPFAMGINMAHNRLEEILQKLK